MERSDITILILGIILTFSGFIIRYIIGRRRFHRRTHGGMQRFENYNKALVTLLIEKIFVSLSLSC